MKLIQCTEYTEIELNFVQQESGNKKVTIFCSMLTLLNLIHK